MHVHNGTNEPISEKLFFLLKINVMYEVACFISGMLTVGVIILPP